VIWNLLLFQALECLQLDDMKLKGDLLTLLAALGSNTSLKELDIRYSGSVWLYISADFILIPMISSAIVSA